MATIRNRGAFQFQAIVKRKGYPRQVKTFEKRRDAERWARNLEAAIDQGEFVTQVIATKMTLSEAIEKYRSEKKTKEKKGALQEGYRLNVLLQSPLAKMALATIRGSDIARYRDARLTGAKWRHSDEESGGMWRGKPVSSQTVRTEIATLSAIFKQAREWHMEGLHNPCDDINRPRPSKARERRFLNADEERRLYEAAANYGSGWLLPLMQLAVETAMRRGEWRNLVWSDLDLTDQVAHLHAGETKNNEPRDVPLSKKACSIFQKLKRQRNPHPWDHIFGEPPGTITAAFTRTRDRARAHYVSECQQANIDADPKLLVDLRWHDLRHEATSRLFEKGLNDMEVSSVTGHKDLKMLKRYTHLEASKLAKKLL